MAVSINEIRKYALEMEERYGVSAPLLVSLALAENPELDPYRTGNYSEVGIFQITDAMLADIQRLFGKTGDRTNPYQATELAALGWKVCEYYADRYGIPRSIENLIAIWNMGIGRTRQRRDEVARLGIDPNADTSWMLPTAKHLLGLVFQNLPNEIELINKGGYR